MHALTGVSGSEWVLLFILTVAAFLIVAGSIEAFRTAPFRARPFLSLATGLALLGVTLIQFGRSIPDALVRIVTDREALFLAGVVCILAVALGDLALGRAARILKALLSRLHVPDPEAGTGALAVSLLLVLLGGLGGVELVDRPRSRESVGPLPIDPATIGWRSGARFLASYEVPGYVVDAELLGERDGYLSMAEGRIVHFALPGTLRGKLALTTVVDGLQNPRGLAILEDTLFVAELGPLPCAPSIRLCEGPKLGPTPAEGELEILRTSRGRVVAFDIDPSGGLSNERVIIDDLPVVSAVHAINQLTSGPDGRLYMSIGGIDYLWKTPEAIDRLERPKLELLGTVVRMSPSGNEVEIFARGFRNVFGLAFDDRGALYGVDNNGPTRGGWRSEELLQIRHEGRYGYPSEGTSRSMGTGSPGPLWLMEGVGSAGIAWRERFGLSPGLLVGSCSRLDSIRLTAVGDGYRVWSPEDVSLLADRIPGCVTAIEPVSDGVALLAIYSFGGADVPYPLLLIDLHDVE